MVSELWILSCRYFSYLFIISIIFPHSYQHKSFAGSGELYRNYLLSGQVHDKIFFGNENGDVPERPSPFTPFTNIV